MAIATGLSPQQISFYEAFGFLKLPGLFRDDIERITDAFEAVFADETNPRFEYYAELHAERRRILIPQFIDKAPVLEGLRHDPRMVALVTSLLGPNYEYAESDGNLLDCDTSWHCDVYGSPLERRHVKLAFYLDPVRADSGALRMIPGTCHFRETFATTLRKRLADAKEIPAEFGVDAEEIPYWPLETDPGDVVALDFRTIHSSFLGADRRRLFTMNFRETTDAQPAAAG